MDYARSEAKAAARQQFKGVWAAITTPFTNSGDLDEDGLFQNMRYLTDELKVQGVFCTGVMGEFWSLSREERMRSVEVVVEAAKDRCRVIAHTGHHSAEETVLLTQHAERVGADFAVVITPYYPPTSEDGILEWFKYVCGKADIGVWMFDGPYTAGGLGPDRGISPELALRISDIENVCGMKQAWPLDDGYDRFHELLADRIVLSHPTERNWLTVMRQYGQQVHMSSPSPYLYQRPGWLPMNDYTEHAQAGDWVAAEKISNGPEMTALREVEAEWLSGRHASTGALPIPWIKAWSSLLGMAAGPVRWPLVSAPSEDYERLRNRLEATALLDR